MTERDLWSHPEQPTFADLWTTLDMMTRYLTEPGNQVDDELLERIVSACNDVARFSYDENCEPSPAWLVSLTEFFDVLLAKARQHRVVSTDLH